MVLSPCQTCGACCAYSADWPRFSMESEAELARIPDTLIAENMSGMKFCEGRCAALSGVIGDMVACTIYDIRPQVCRDCMPGDEECLVARSHYKLPPL